MTMEKMCASCGKKFDWVGSGPIKDGRYLSLCVTSTSNPDKHLIAPAPDLASAASFAKAALEAIEGCEADDGGRFPDDYEIGRINDSRGSASFRIRVGHIRQLAAALAKAGA